MYSISDRLSVASGPPALLVSCVDGHRMRASCTHSVRAGLVPVGCALPVGVTAVAASKADPEELRMCVSLFISEWEASNISVSQVEHL